jgi:hypothetical protein
LAPRASELNLSAEVCGVRLALHVLRALWSERRMQSIRHKVDMQLNTALSHVEGIHRSVEQWNVASQIKIPAYRSAFPPPPLLLFTITTLDFYMYFYTRRILVQLCSVVLFHFFVFVSSVTPKPTVKRIQPNRELEMLNSEMKEGRIWFGNR